MRSTIVLHREKATRTREGRGLGGVRGWGGSSSTYREKVRLKVSTLEGRGLYENYLLYSSST
jgi:hypothetical protein